MKGKRRTLSDASKARLGEASVLHNASQASNDKAKGEYAMNLTPEQRETVTNELKKFGADLNLSEEQKGKLHTFLTDSFAKIQEFRTQNPSATKEEIVKKLAANRAQLRERLTNFLTPEQLQKWDTATAKAKEFLGQKIAA